MKIISIRLALLLLVTLPVLSHAQDKRTSPQTTLSTHHSVSNTGKTDQPFQLHVYPNPATEKLHIDIKEEEQLIYQIRLFSLPAGKQVLSVMKQRSSTINLKRFLPGVYILQVQGPESITQKRLFIH